MKIAFWGVPDLGLICLSRLMASNKNITVVIPPAMSHPAYSLMVSSANSYGIPVLSFKKTPKERDFIEKFKEFAPDIAVVCSFNNLIPDEVLKIPAKGFINCHPSLLPNYRGGNPYFHVIYNGEEKTGTSIHYMDASFDTGDIIMQEEMIISSDETLGTLFNKLNYQCANLVNKVLTMMEAGEDLPRIAQDKKSEFPTAPNIGQNEATTFINWNSDACHIERFVRGLNPFFGAKSYFRNNKIRFWSGKYDMSFKAANVSLPGTIIDIDKDKIIIATGKGVFIPTVIQIEYFLITDVKDFIKRTNPQIGEMFH